MRYLTSILLGLAIVGCCRNGNDEMSRFHEDGRTKPSVAIAAMLDTTSFDASWSVSEELTAGITNSISGNGEIFVHSQEESPFTENPFSSDLAWITREFHSEEFVAFLELVEHEFAPITSNSLAPHEASHNLNMAVRIRVVDLRASTPKIVLQEMIQESYFVPKTLIPTDYSSIVWGSETYQKSPMGIAHARLIQEIANRISDYILLAKSR